MYSPGDDDDAPSPCGHLLLQCQLIRKITEKFGVIDTPLPLETAVQLQEEIGEWMLRYPRIYATEDPDISLDARYPWLAMQRPHLHAVSLAMMLVPLKPYLVNPVSAASSDLEHDVRSRGVDICIRLMDTAQVLFRTVYPNDAKFHFSFFALFDTSAILCSAMQHDANNTLPRRGEILCYIRAALDMLRELTPLTETASTAFKVLKKLVVELPLEPEERLVLGLGGCSGDAATKRQKREGNTAAPDVDTSSPGGSSWASSSLSHETTNTTSETSVVINGLTVVLHPDQMGGHRPAAAAVAPGLLGDGGAGDLLQAVLPQMSPRDTPGVYQHLEQQQHYPQHYPQHYQGFDDGGGDIGIDGSHDGVPLDFGDLGEIWDWQVLDLGLGAPPPTGSAETFELGQL